MAAWSIPHQLDVCAWEGGGADTWREGMEGGDGERGWREGMDGGDGGRGWREGMERGDGGGDGWRGWREGMEEGDGERGWREGRYVGKIDVGMHTYIGYWRSRNKGRRTVCTFVMCEGNIVGIAGERRKQVGNGALTRSAQTSKEIAKFTYEQYATINQ